MGIDTTLVSPWGRDGTARSMVAENGAAVEVARQREEPSETGMGCLVVLAAEAVWKTACFISTLAKALVTSAPQVLQGAGSGAVVGALSLFVAKKKRYPLTKVLLSDQPRGRGILMLPMKGRRGGPSQFS